jgi:hypothetical protein
VDVAGIEIEVERELSSPWLLSPSRQVRHRWGGTKDSGRTADSVKIEVERLSVVLLRAGLRLGTEGRSTDLIQNQPCFSWGEKSGEPVRGIGVKYMIWW